MGNFMPPNSQNHKETGPFNCVKTVPRAMWGTDSCPAWWWDGQVIPKSHRFQEKGLLCSSQVLPKDSRADQLTLPKSIIISHRNIYFLSEGIQQFATVLKDSSVLSNLSMKLPLHCNTTLEFIIKNAAYKNQISVLIPLTPSLHPLFQIPCKRYSSWSQQT